MDKMEFAIAFVTGRSNVCNVINTYYKDIIDQVSRYKKEIETTIYIVIDLNYQETDINQFYKLSKEVMNSSLKIKYVTPDMIKEEKNNVVDNGLLNPDQIDKILGSGHDKGRNTVLYYAKKDKIDYLLFWDDDEYPYANIKNEDGSITWKKQDNILEHLKYIEDCDVTIGYHCGYISPIPFLDSKTEIDEESLKKYIEAVSNDIITWESIKEKFEKNNGVTYANPKIANGQGVYEIQYKKGGKWVAGSTLCLNLKNIDNIPAFYNPKGARGEDTFFSTKLQNAKVMKIPVYHFHDGFLKYTQILKEDYPKKLVKIGSKSGKIGERFLKASVGWVKYKPLFLYITDKENYKERLDKTRAELEDSVDSMNKVFEGIDFKIVLKEFNEYYKYLYIDYEKYLEVNDIWNNIKYKI